MSCKGEVETQVNSGSLFFIYFPHDVSTLISDNPKRRGVSIVVEHSTVTVAFPKKTHRGHFKSYYGLRSSGSHPQF